MNLNVGLPDFGLPDVSLPNISLPDINLPDISLPDLGDLPPNTTLIASTVLIVLAIIIIAVVAPCVLTSIVAALGFTAQGILAGSKATVIMAWYGGYVTVGSICAILQSIGAAGLSVTGTILTSVLGVAIAVTLVIIVLLLKNHPFHAPTDD